MGYRKFRSVRSLLEYFRFSLLFVALAGCSLAEPELGRKLSLVVNEASSETALIPIAVSDDGLSALEPKVERLASVIEQACKMAEFIGKKQAGATSGFSWQSSTSVETSENSKIIRRTTRSKLEFLPVIGDYSLICEKGLDDRATDCVSKPATNSTEVARYHFVLRDILKLYGMVESARWSELIVESSPDKKSRLSSSRVVSVDTQGFSCSFDIQQLVRN